MNVRIDLNDPQILAKVQSDRFGLLVSNEWKRLIDPYTPRDTGTMQNTAKLYPFQIHYIQPYSSAVYYMKNAKFQKKNPYSTYEWDKAAANAGQKDKLIRTINAALQSGQY
jgi:hypothetical protein